MELPEQGTRAAASKHYGTMTVDQLKKMGVGAAGGGIADSDCALFMWATFPMLREALDVIEAWGFSYKTVAFNWVKQNKTGAACFGVSATGRAATQRSACSL